MDLKIEIYLASKGKLKMQMQNVFALTILSWVLILKYEGPNNSFYVFDLKYLMNGKRLKTLGLISLIILC